MKAPVSQLYPKSDKNVFVPRRHRSPAEDYRKFANAVQEDRVKAIVETP